MEIIEEHLINKEVANEIKNRTEFIWFYSGKAYKEKLYVIPNCKNTPPQDLMIKLNQFLQTLPLATLSCLCITEIVVFTSFDFETFKYDFLSVKRYNNNNVSFNVTNKEGYYYLSLYNNDLVLC